MCKGKKVSELEFIERANIIHKNKYDYSLINLKTLSVKIKIICPIHGEFSQSPMLHLTGHGCKKCATIITSNKTKSSEDNMILKFQSVHKFKYDYSLVNYINNNTFINIICPEHGVFTQKPRGHITYGCPKCHIRGYSKSKWIEICTKNKNSNLYIIQCYNEIENFIKIGITSHSLEKRFSNTELPYKYNTILLINNNPEVIWGKERELHRMFKSFSYVPKINFNGLTECFTTEILDYILIV